MPTGLQRLLEWILEENVVQSWHFSGENNLLLSIRFTAMLDITTSIPQQSLSSSSNQQAINSNVYRSKPPSAAVNWDNKCQQAWLSGMQGAITDNMEYQQDLFTYALNCDGSAHGKQSPLPNTSIVYV